MWSHWISQSALLSTLLSICNWLFFQALLFIFVCVHKLTSVSSIPPLCCYINVADAASLSFLQSWAVTSRKLRAAELQQVSFMSRLQVFALTHPDVPAANVCLCVCVCVCVWRVPPSRMVNISGWRGGRGPLLSCCWLLHNAEEALPRKKKLFYICNFI